MAIAMSLPALLYAGLYKMFLGSLVNLIVSFGFFVRFPSDEVCFNLRYFSIVLPQLLVYFCCIYSIVADRNIFLTVCTSRAYFSFIAGKKTKIEIKHNNRTIL